MTLSIYYGNRRGRYREILTNVCELQVFGTMIQARQTDGTSIDLHDVYRIVSTLAGEPLPDEVER